MKKSLLFLMLIAGPALAQRPYDPAKLGIHIDTIGVSHTSTKSPCDDSLFLALSKKKYDELTAGEHAYFQQHWDQCNEQPVQKVREVRDGNTPEWIVAVFTIISAAAAVIVLTK